MSNFRRRPSDDISVREKWQIDYWNGVTLISYHYFSVRRRLFDENQLIIMTIYKFQVPKWSVALMSIRRRWWLNTFNLITPVNNSMFFSTFGCGLIFHFWIIISMWRQLLLHSIECRRCRTIYRSGNRECATKMDFTTERLERTIRWWSFIALSSKWLSVTDSCMA